MNLGAQHQLEQALLAAMGLSGVGSVAAMDLRFRAGEVLSVEVKLRPGAEVPAALYHALEDGQLQFLAVSREPSPADEAERFRSMVADRFHAIETCYLRAMADLDYAIRVRAKKGEFRDFVWFRDQKRCLAQALATSHPAVVIH